MPDAGFLFAVRLFYCPDSPAGADRQVDTGSCGSFQWRRIMV